MSIMILFIIIIALLILLYYYTNTLSKYNIETLSFNIPSRISCPTRNQSYDLRGDPIAVPREDLLLNTSSIGPMEPDLCHRRGFDIE